MNCEQQSFNLDAFGRDDSFARIHMKGNVRDRAQVNVRDREQRNVRDRVLDSAYISAKKNEHINAHVPLITFVSASGGVGKSTLALLIAYMCAQSGLNTVLMEGDLQFGDFNFWLGLDDSLPNLADENPKPVHVAQNLDVYKAPTFPELAEDVSDSIVDMREKLCAGYDIAFVDTGGFWSGFTADMLLSSDLFCMTIDNRSSSVAGAIKASELCSRLGIPLMRMAVLYNRYFSRAVVNEREVKKALDVQEVYCVPDGRSTIEDMVGSGNIEELFLSDNAMVNAVRNLVKPLVSRVGIELCGIGFVAKKTGRRWHG